MTDLVKMNYSVITNAAKGDTSPSSRQPVELIANLKQIAEVASRPANDSALLRRSVLNKKPVKPYPAGDRVGEGVA